MTENLFGAIRTRKGIKLSETLARSSFNRYE